LFCHLKWKLLLKPLAMQLWAHFKRLTSLLILVQPSKKVWEQRWIS
jgi:hypothetical protein